MCGIAGTYGFGTLATLRRMTDAIAHRGPDGTYLFEDAPVFLGNRRLAIRDIEGGKQPMTNEDGSVVVVYNGEIYNYAELRDDLVARGHVLKTTCDTEILPYMYEEFGVEFAARLNGIFAIALWDRSRRRLFLYRDPLGVKPLVYATDGPRLAFGSEAKAVLGSGLLGPELNPLALHLSMNVRYIPGNQTMFRGIARLAPGHVAEIGEAGITTRAYAGIDWSPDETLSEADWLDGIREKLEAAVERQLVSDVPIGVSLSGGIDSSALVALIRRRHSGDLKTFTLGFDEPSDENADARLVAERFETSHHDLVLREPALKHLERAVYFTEEPKVNCLQLYMLHDYLGGHVKVALSGLGGDELFAGYDFYRYLLASDRARRWTPAAPWRALAGSALDAITRAGARLGAPGADLLVRKLEWGAAMHDGCRQYLLLRNAWDFNRVLLERVYEPDFLASVASRTRDFYAGHFATGNVADDALRAEFDTKMVNDLLHNEDTMSMASSVESRVPMLDLEFVRFAARIPAELRFQHGLKGMLKRALAEVLPTEVLHKKKWGFTVDPVAQYKKDLKPLAESVLLDPGFAERRIFRRSFIEAVLDARPAPRLRWHYFMLWQMIGFDFWCRQFMEGGR
ncbi:MAG: asparagine synthase (glutamine-hydrolyzing) [Paracoccaceae bacterium]